MSSVEKKDQFRGQRWLDGWLMFSKSASKKQAAWKQKAQEEAFRE